MQVEAEAEAAAAAGDAAVRRRSTLRVRRVRRQRRPAATPQQRPLRLKVAPHNRLTWCAL